MSRPAGGRKIRVLYVDEESTRPEFARLVRERVKNLEITTTSRPEEVVEMLRKGFDCLILGNGRGSVEGQKIARSVREGGYSSLPIIMRGQPRVTAKGEAVSDAFYDEQRSSQRVEELAATIQGLAEGTSTRIDVKKRGIHAPIG
jgi:DNA-binding NtrC family response regulator